MIKLDPDEVQKAMTVNTLLRALRLCPRDAKVLAAWEGQNIAVKGIEMHPDPLVVVLDADNY